jgi:hypothetical protein
MVTHKQLASGALRPDSKLCAALRLWSKHYTLAAFKLLRKNAAKSQCHHAANDWGRHATSLMV